VDTSYIPLLFVKLNERALERLDANELFTFLKHNGVTNDKKNPRKRLLKQAKTVMKKNNLDAEYKELLAKVFSFSIVLSLNGKHHFV